MPIKGSIIRLLVASPSDCSEERKVIQDIVHKWNQANTISSNTIIEAVLWESHAIPELGKRPQQLINERLVDSSDILVGVFWTRIGSSTGQMVSGTVEEIERFIFEGKRAMLYFSKKPIKPELIDPDQYRALQEFKSSLNQRGLYFEYDEMSEFVSMFGQHLSITLNELLNGNFVNYSAAEVDLVALAHELVDVFIKYSESPPAAELSEYAGKEDAFKRHINKHRLELGKDIVEQAEYIGIRMRSLTKLGNQMADLLGGDGRPDIDMLNEWKEELDKMARSLTGAIESKRLEQN